MVLTVPGRGVRLPDGELVGVCDGVRLVVGVREGLGVGLGNTHGPTGFRHCTCRLEEEKLWQPPVQK